MSETKGGNIPTLPEDVPAEQKEVIDAAVNLLAWSGSNPMGLSLMTALLDREPEDLMEALPEAVEAKMMTKTEAGYQLEETVYTTTRTAFPLKDNVEWVVVTARRSGDWFEQRRKESAEDPEFLNEFPHLTQWLENVTGHSPTHQGRLTWLSAYPPFHAAEMDKAKALVLEAVQLMDQETTWEKYAVEKAHMLTDMGFIHGELGNQEESLKVHREGLELMIKGVGEKHNETASLLSNIGITYDNLGNKDEAVAHYKRAMEIRKELYGDDHPETASSINNVGTSYFEGGRFRDAIEYLEKALDIRNRTLGIEERDTIDSLYNYAVCLINLKKFKEGFDLVNKFLKQMSPQHPQYKEVASLIPYIDNECLKSGFRPPSAATASKGGSKKKKKKKKKK